MQVYFVTTGLWEEIQVIKKVRPPRLLCSYWYFKNKPLADFCRDLGYRPEILLDSGAYSAFTKGKNVNLLDYMDYINANRWHIEKYVSLDVIGDEHLTFLIYLLMKSHGMNPIPVVHYSRGANEVLRRYALNREKKVALGGTVPIRDKEAVASWCEDVKRAHPTVSLHLLGSSSKKLLQSEALASCDSSTWYLQAINGRPNTIPGKSREAKMARAEANMRSIMEEFNETPVPFIDRGGEPADC
jgi:hypothetical protein